MSEEPPRRDGPSAEVPGYIETAVDSLFSIARLWASHGLNVGKTTLDAAAETLKKGSETLAQFSERVEHGRDGAPAADTDDAES